MLSVFVFKHAGKVLYHAKKNLFNQNSSCTEILKFASVPYFLVYKVYKMPNEFSDLLFSR